jgi:hypothetical protein
MHKSASDRDGNDAGIRASADSPSGGLGPDEVSGRVHLEVEDLPGETGNVDKRPKTIGPRMLKVAEFVRTHPGAYKAEVRRGAGLYPNPFGYSETALERAERAGLVYSFKTVSGRVRFYPAGYDTDGRAGMWKPGHP